MWVLKRKFIFIFFFTRHAIKCSGCCGIVLEHIKRSPRIRWKFYFIARTNLSKQSIKAVTTLCVFCLCNFFTFIYCEILRWSCRHASSSQLLASSDPTKNNNLRFLILTPTAAEADTSARTKIYIYIKLWIYYIHVYIYYISF